MKSHVFYLCFISCSNNEVGVIRNYVKYMDLNSRGGATELVEEWWATKEWADNAVDRDAQGYYYNTVSIAYDIMMTSSNGNVFRVNGPLWGESTGDRWIPLLKASDAELWCFLLSAPEQTNERTIETLVIWEAITFIMTSL